MPGVFRVELKGAKQLKRKLEQLATAYPEATGRAIHDEAVDIFAESQRLVPEDTSALKLSGYVSPPEMEAGGPTVEIGYGNLEGGPVDYAVYVHEGPQKNWQKPGASNLFLLKPAQQAVQGMEGRIRVKVRGVT